MQATLFDPLRSAVQTKMCNGTTNQERFQTFHKADPLVYHALQPLSPNQKSVSHGCYSSKRLFEVLRSEDSTRTASDDGFRRNNIFSSQYAHLLTSEESERKGFFEMRNCRGR